MADAKTESKKAPKVNEYGQTEKEFKDAHGGRTPDEVNPPAGEVDEKHQEEKKKERWG